MLKIVNRPVTLDGVMSSDCRVVYEYWRGLLGARTAPAWSDIDLIDIPGYIVQFVRVVDVVDAGADFVYRFWGTGLVDVIGSEWTGRRLSSLGDGRADALLVEFRKVVTTQTPVCVVYEADVAAAKLAGGALQAPTIRLPLSSDGATVDRVLSYTDYQTSRERWKTFYETDRE